MYPGFSGGPLVNTAGQIAGLNTSALLRGISVAIPTATVKRVAEILLAHGRVRRGYSGGDRAGRPAARQPSASSSSRRRVCC